MTEELQIDSKINLTTNMLKYVAIITMVIDHLAWAFVPSGTALAILMHFIGKTTGPIMFYFAVEGYHHTRNINKYIARLAFFALISYFPFIYFNAGGILADMQFTGLNVIFTILMGVLAIRVRRELKNPVIKTVIILCLIIFCIPSDWSTWGIIMIIVFDFYYGDFKNQTFGYCMIVLLNVGVLALITRPFFGLIYDHNFIIDWELYKYKIENIGMFMPIFLLYFYNGQKGKSSKFSKWFFYVFYPLHLFILGVLQILIKFK